MDVEAVLHENGRVYDEFVQRIQRMSARWDVEQTLQYVRIAADFASQNHTGRFADGSLDALLLQAGRNLDAHLTSGRQKALVAGIPTLKKPRGRHVVHVITYALAGGGPTRTLKNWIDIDADSTSSVVLIDQGQYATPSWVSESVERSGGNLVTLPHNLSLIARAKWLREVCRSADVVVLHTYTFDVVPSVAFAIPGGPPVALVNHSDHIFWINGSVADLVVHQRSVSNLVSDRRFVSRETLLPIPLGTPAVTLTKAEARRGLGIPDSQIAVLSVGSVWKLFPTRRHNFRETCLKLLDQNPEVHLYVLAWDWGFKPEFLYGIKHHRFHYFPEQLDASAYQAAADVYIEGFPIGSQTAMLEAAYIGLPIVRAFAPTHRVLVADDEAINAIVEPPRDEDEYLRCVRRYVCDPDARRRDGEALRSRVATTHSGPSWRNRLAEIYAELSKKPHTPTPLSPSRFEVAAVDLALCDWQQARARAETPHAQPLQAVPSELADRLRRESLAARKNGNYRMAFDQLRDACRIGGWNKRRIAAMARLVPGAISSWLT